MSISGLRMKSFKVIGLAVGLSAMLFLITVLLASASVQAAVPGVSSLSHNSVKFATNLADVSMAYPYPEPEITIEDVTITEGNSGIVQAIFSVLRSGYLGDPSTVDFTTSDGSALQPVDYTAKTGQVDFTEDEDTKTITIDVQGDLLDEPNESFNLTLYNPSNAVLVDDEGLGTINDDDPPPVLSITDVTVIDGYTTNVLASFEITLDAPSGKTVTVNYTTQNDTAAAPGDYTSRAGILTFLPGQTSISVDVTVIGSLTPEGQERFYLNLSGAFNASLGDNQGIGTILKYIQALPVVFKN